MKVLIFINVAVGIELKHVKELLDPDSDLMRVTANQRAWSITVKLTLENAVV